MPANLLSILIVVIVILGAVGIALIVTRAAGITIPSWVVQILWIVLAVTLGVLAIRWIAGFAL